MTEATNTAPTALTMEEALVLVREASWNDAARRRLHEAADAIEGERAGLLRMIDDMGYVIDNLNACLASEEDR